jgi:hypothetical protein
LFPDEPIATVDFTGRLVITKHPLAAFVCHDHFMQVMGLAVER